MASSKEIILKMHEEHHGVLSIHRELNVTNKEELGNAYTPGVAVISKLIEKYPELKSRYTMSGKLVVVLTDGSAVLGLGNIGPAGGLPVVEGKSLLYKDLANVDAIPMAINQVGVEEFVNIVKNISVSFAGIHLEDIAAPRCFEIEEKLVDCLNIPVYHDDQEGTAMVVLAALINAAKVSKKPLKTLKVVVNGIGAAGVATVKLLLAFGISDIALVDIHGIVTSNDSRYNKYQRQLANQVSCSQNGSTLHDVIKERDVFIGLSDADVINPSDVNNMADNPIIFALANPNPEISPELITQTKTKVFATGSSQYPNQVNNILIFPGLYKGLLKTNIKHVTYDLEKKVAVELASLVKQPTTKHIIPGVFEKKVVDTVCQAVIDFSKE